MRVDGGKIRALRQDKGLTTVEVARLANVARGTLYLLEKNRGNVKMSTLRAVCAAIGVDIREVFSDD